jgi:hypothetical protein
VSCFEPPPEYIAPGRVPPVFNSLQAEPSVTDVHLVEDTTDAIQFKIPFRSEDAGHALQASFILDMDPSEEGAAFYQTRAVQPIPTSTKPFQEQTGERAVQWSWSRATFPTSGCHSLTVLLTYADNTLDNYHVFDDSLAAIETWWFNFDGGQTLLEDCPPNGGRM